MPDTLRACSTSRFVNTQTFEEELCKLSAISTCVQSDTFWHPEIQHIVIDRQICLSRWIDKLINFTSFQPHPGREQPESDKTLKEFKICLQRQLPDINIIWRMFPSGGFVCTRATRPGRRELGGSAPGATPAREVNQPESIWGFICRIERCTAGVWHLPGPVTSTDLCTCVS